MKSLKKIISIALAVLTVASVATVAGVSVSAKALKKPTGLKAENYEKSIKVSWKKVKGASKYKLYRGKKVVKTTSKTSYKDFSVSAGNKYTYKVKAVKGKKTSKASKSVTITRINYTIIRTINNGNGNVKLTWNNRAGANQYKLYRKASGSYSLIKKTSSLAYTDKNVTSGTKYTYKIVCYNTKTKSKSLDCTAMTITYLDKVTGVYARENTDGKSVALKWNSSKGAASYDILRMKAGETTYSKIASTSSTAYTDTKLSNNPTAYTYQVVATKNGSSSVSSDLSLTPYLPKRDGMNSYYYDENNDLHVILKLNKGDKYVEGKALSDFLSLEGLYDAVVISGDDIIALNDSVITAKNSGFAEIKINLSETAVNLLKESNAMTRAYNRFGNKTVYVEIEVA